MKILDWVHRKLQPTTKYSRVSHKNAPAFEHDVVDRIDPAQRPTSVGTEPDTETPLLLHVNLAGILTIGTLGYSHPLFLPHSPEEQPTLELPEKDTQWAAKLPTQITLLPPVTESLVIITEHSAVKVHVAEEKIMAEPLLKEDMERKERTTLGDLLAIEKNVNLCDQAPAVTGSTWKSTSASNLKKGSKEKKKKKKKRDELELSESRSPAATERIHRMIKKMVKKKIHPEAAAMGKKSGGAADVAADLMLAVGDGGGGGAAIALAH